MHKLRSYTPPTRTGRFFGLFASSKVVTILLSCFGAAFLFAGLGGLPSGARGDHSYNSSGLLFVLKLFLIWAAIGTAALIQAWRQRLIFVAPFVTQYRGPWKETLADATIANDQMVRIRRHRGVPKAVRSQLSAASMASRETLWDIAYEYEITEPFRGVSQYRSPTVDKALEERYKLVEQKARAMQALSSEAFALVFRSVSQPIPQSHAEIMWRELQGHVHTLEELDKL